MRNININKTYVKVFQNIYRQATARIHVDHLVSNEFPINRGVRQGDPFPPKLFTDVMEEIFKKADISEGIPANLLHLTKKMERHLNSLNSKSRNVDLKIYKGATKYKTKYTDTEDIQIEQE